MEEETMTNSIMGLINDNMIDVDDDDLCYERAESVVTIGDSGYLCGDNGCVVQMADGSEFIIRVQKVR